MGLLAIWISIENFPARDPPSRIHGPSSHNTEQKMADTPFANHEKRMLRSHVGSTENWTVGMERPSGDWSFGEKAFCWIAATSDEPQNEFLIEPHFQAGRDYQYAI